MPAVPMRLQGTFLLVACCAVAPATVMGVALQEKTLMDTALLEQAIQSLSRLGSSSRVESVRANMTLDESFKLLPPLPSDLRSFIEQRFAGNHNVAFLKTGSKVRHLRANRSRSVEEAREMLNEFIEETVERLDTEKIRCASDLNNQMVLISQASADLSDYSAQASDAKADISRAETNIEELRVTRESLEEELEEHNRICFERIKYYKDEITVMEADAEIMAGIVNMTTCDGEGLFVQCASKSGTQVRFAASSVQQKVSQIKSNRTYHRLQAAMEQLYKMGDHRKIEKRTLAQVSSEKRKTTKGHLRHASVRKHAGPEEELLGPEPEEEEESCTLATNPNCGKLLDKFMELSGAVESDLEKYNKDLADEESRCKTTKDSMDAQITDLEERSMNWETSLAEATSRETHAQQMMQEKSVEKSDLMAEFNDMRADCTTNIETCESEMCALGKIRGELYKMSSTPPYIVDCQVSEWTSEECSVSCAGGVHNFTRTITVPPELGAACPPLALEQACNVQECPVDCSISEWSGWSACSAKCGGGVRERMRTIEEHARFGGVPCGAASQTQPCNLQACDVDCVLGPWTKEYETKCSKACDGGTKRLTRAVDIPAVGMGACPSEESPERLEEKPCNEFACDPTQGDTLKCNSKLDIILLLDGSGSLGETGWEQTKEIAKMLISSFNPQAGNENGTKVATMLFSGPQYWSSYYRCLGQRLLPGEVVDMQAECGMDWVEHLTDDTSGMDAKIDALVWPQMTTFTSEALLMADAELTYGRPDADKVVICITDGIPLNEWHTSMAAEVIKGRARLIFVPVGGGVALDDVAGWASKPVKDNVVVIENFEDMTTPETINKIVADTCPEVL